MSDQIITPDNVTREMLKSIFEAAFMTISIDSDGDIIVKEQCNCYVIPNKEQRRIWLLTQFSFKPSASELEKLRCINKINKDYIMVRAVAADRNLRFTYDVILDGGVSSKTLVLTIKRFCAIPHEAVRDYGSDIVE